MALDEDLLQALKERAARERTTLQALTNELLRGAMTRDEAKEPYRLEIKAWKASLQPGVDLFDRDKLFDLMEGR